MKTLSPWMKATLAISLAASFSLSANAQSGDFPQPLRHLASSAMSAADRTQLNARRGELAESAKIYGYNLEAGNWSHEQTLCASMPDTIMLHYFQKFPDGTESLFTVLVPRGQGRLRVVPILYHNGTPYVPAPRNPRNYALFNELVPSGIAQADIASSSKWLELSACYAELTGASIDLSSSRTANIGIAEAPAATIHLDAQGKTAHVMFADRDGSHAYRLWSISFNRDGRVTAAVTGNYSVYAAKTQPQTQLQTPLQTQTLPQAQPAAIAETQSSGQRVEATEQAAGQNPEQAKEQTASGTPPAVPAASMQRGQPATLANRTAAASSLPSPAAANLSKPAVEPGWKFIPDAPPPPEKMMPQPPDPWAGSARSDQQPQ